jgi:serine/threonine-protein kinase
MTQAAATHQLERAGFDVTLAPAAFSESVPKGDVVSTDPAPGSRVLDHGTIALTLSRGKERYHVPKLENLTVDEAQDALAKAHLSYGRSVRRWSDSVSRGTVIDSNPAPGTRQRPDTVVDLVVSRGPAPVQLTDWTGKSAARAKHALTSHRLGVETTLEYSDQVPEGLVISQDPATGVVHHGDTVKLVVSRGPELVEVPGGLPTMGVEAATQLLESLGFKVDVEHARIYLGLGYVASSSPGGGNEIPKGSKVILRVV